MLYEEDVDTGLLKEALKFDSSKTKEEVINQALKEFIQVRIEKPRSQGRSTESSDDPIK